VDGVVAEAPALAVAPHLVGHLRRRAEEDERRGEDLGRRHDVAEALGEPGGGGLAVVGGHDGLDQDVPLDVAVARALAGEAHPPVDLGVRGDPHGARRTPLSCNAPATPMTSA